MNLFIDNPQAQPPRSADGHPSMSLWHEQAARVAIAHVPDAAADDVARTAYRDEMEFANKRARSRKRGQVLRVVVSAVLFPLLLLLVFFAAYALTCIANGASPNELVGLMAELIERMGEFVTELTGWA